MVKTKHRICQKFQFLVFVLQVFLTFVRNVLTILNYLLNNVVELSAYVIDFSFGYNRCSLLVSSLVQNEPSQI